MQDKKKLFPLVKKEAKALRTHLTTVEKSNLDYKWIDSNDVTRCVYGQATGHCHSPRALRLIKAHCSRVYEVLPGYKNMLADVKLNGTPVGKKRSKHGKVSFFSPIEIMIYEKGQKRNTKKLISYIKGEIDELVLN
jgi:hypothetical protein